MSMDDKTFRQLGALINADHASLQETMGEYPHQVTALMIALNHLGLSLARSQGLEGTTTPEFVAKVPKYSPEAAGMAAIKWFTNLPPQGHYMVIRCALSTLRETAHRCEDSRRLAEEFDA